MAITTKTQDDLVNGQVAAMQAASAGLLDFGVGSILRAFAQGVAAVATWLQAIVLQLTLLTRLATSVGADADSFVNDYGMTRLAAQAAKGQATFSRFSTTGTAVVPVGTIVETADGAQQFLVPADATNPAYSAPLAGFVMNAGTASVTVAVSAVTPGAGGNVTAGAITVITGAVPGVDTVSNAFALAGGMDAETDTALRTRFVQYINSRGAGTPAAVDYAVTSTQQGLDYELVENYDYTGAWRPGYFYVVVDDGSGTPPSSLLTTIQANIQAVRSLTSLFGVFPPVLETVNVAMTVHGITALQAQQALQAYINGVGLNGTVQYTRLSQVVFNAGALTVSGVTLNGGTSDLVCTVQQRPVPGTLTITVI